MFSVSAVGAGATVLMAVAIVLGVAAATILVIIGLWP